MFIPCIQQGLQSSTPSLQLLPWLCIPFLLTPSPGLLLLLLSRHSRLPGEAQQCVEPWFSSSAAAKSMECGSDPSLLLSQLLWVLADVAQGRTCWAQALKCLVSRKKETALPFRAGCSLARGKVSGTGLESTEQAWPPSPFLFLHGSAWDCEEAAQCHFAFPPVCSSSPAHLPGENLFACV